MTVTLCAAKTSWLGEGEVERKWHLIDIKGQVLGRAATRIAMLLMGKTKPNYTPSLDCGDFVIAINAGKFKLTGNKLEDKVIFHHTAHPGGARTTTYKRILETRPERALYLAVKRMLPKNKLASRQILRLKIYCTENHPHTAQNPVKLELQP